MGFEETLPHILDGLGLGVERIPERESKTPDFVVRCSKYSYLVELKEKSPDLTRFAEREKRLEAGEVFDESTLSATGT